MDETPDRFDPYLADGELLVTVYPTAPSEESSENRTPSVVGVTDRRLIALSDAHGFTSVAHADVVSIRSTERDDLGVEWEDARLLLPAGGLLAGVGLLGFGVLSIPIPTVVLALLTVAGVLVLFFGYYGAVDGYVDRLDTITDRDVRVPAERGRLLAGGGALTVLGGIGTTLVSSNVVTVSLALLLAGATWGGLLTADYAWRHRDDLPGFAVVRRTQKHVALRTNHGTTVSFWVDREQDLDQMLSRVIYADQTARHRDTARTPVASVD